MLASLQPLGGCLRHLCLEDAGQQRVAWKREAVLSALPCLKHLDGDVGNLRNRPPGWQGAQQWRHQAAAPPFHGSREEWEAQTLLWALNKPGAVEMAHRAHGQQEALRAMAPGQQCQEQEGSGSMDCCNPPGAGTTLGLTALRQAAAASTHPSSTDFQEQEQAQSSAEVLRGAQRRFLLLAGGMGFEDLTLLSVAHYQRLLNQLDEAATVVQTAWRGHASRLLRMRLVEALQATRRAAAAARIQAVWRGWICRSLRHAWVQRRLAGWRLEWQEAQELVLRHRQDCAATCLQVGSLHAHRLGKGRPACFPTHVVSQAAWRGWWVRRQVKRAHEAALHLCQLPGRHSTSDGLEPDCCPSPSSLGLGELLQAGGEALLNSPEVLQPGLALPLLREAQAPAAAYEGCTGILESMPAAAAAQQHSDELPGGEGQPSESAMSRVAAEEGAWCFSNPATAAAFAALQQRRQAPLRRQEAEKRRASPWQRLERFHGKHRAAASRRSMATAASGGGTGDESGWQLPALHPSAGSLEVARGQKQQVPARATMRTSVRKASLDQGSWPATVGRECGGSQRAMASSVQPRLMHFPSQ